MADEPAPDAVPEQTSEPKKGGGRKTAIIVGVLMLLEGVGIFAVTRMVSPRVAAADVGGDGAQSSKTGLEAPDDLVEIAIADCRPVNRVSGRLVVVRIRVAVVVARDFEEDAKKLFEERKARVEDRINFVIRSAEIQHLNEPGLETIKRRLKFELGRIVGDDKVIEELLIPELQQTIQGL